MNRRHAFSMRAAASEDTHVSIEEPYDEVRQLITSGKETGDLLSDDISELLPSEITSSDELDELFKTFGSAGIEIIDSDQTYLRDEKPLDRTAEGAESMISMPALRGIEQLVELVGGGDFRRQQLVDLVGQQVAFFLAAGDQLPYVVVLFFDRHVRILRCARGYTSADAGRGRAQACTPW